MRRSAWRALLVLLAAATSLSGSNGHTARIVATSATGAAAAPSTLLDDLSSYWKLDEAAGGARADELGLNDLTEHGGVTQESGKILQSAGFNGSSQYLTANDSASLDSGDISLTLACWVYMPVLPSTAGHIYSIANKSSFSAEAEYVLYIDTDDMVKFQVWRGDLGANDTTIGLSTVSASTWTHILGERNKTTGKVNLWIDGVSQDPTTISVTPTAGTAGLVVGRFGFTGDRYFAGRIDGCGFWKKAFSTDEIAELYNAGAGVDYPF